MTAVSVGIGVLGALFFLSSTPVYQLTGALLFLLHSILDGCDGEIARLKYLESRWGGILDFWGDNVVHSAVFACIGLGWQMAIETFFPLALVMSAVIGTLLSAGFVYRQTMRDKTSGGPLFTSITASDAPSRLSTLADSLAKRDFIYLVVILSAFGKARWFLVLAAIGAPLFFFILLWSSHRERVTV
jgi:phosphatidylglycerophosphate synthase